MGINAVLLSSEEVEEERIKDFDHLKLKNASHIAKGILNKKNKLLNKK